MRISNYDFRYDCILEDVTRYIPRVLDLTRVRIHFSSFIIPDYRLDDGEHTLVYVIEQHL
jgi:hypothetical protein